jgi:hypothetical protein
MMPTPNIYLNKAQDPYHDLHSDLKSTEARLSSSPTGPLQKDEEGKLQYGYERSASLAFGDVVVDLGANVTWEDLLEASRTQKRLKPVDLKHIHGYHVIAHSRGTDVATAMLRELTIEMRAKGLDPQQELKIHNFIIAAPDINLEVAVQRISGDKIPLSAKRFTIYTSPGDKAIGFARKLFQSPRGRVGTYGPDAIDKHLRAGLEFGKDNYSVINFCPQDIGK